MSHQHNVNSQFIQYRRKLFTPLDDIAVVCMAGCRIYRMMEDHCFPSHIRILIDRLFHKLLMLRCRTVIGVDIHEQRIIVHEPVIRTCRCRSQPRALIRQIKVFVVRRIAAVVVADRGHACQRCERVIDISCILLFIVIYIHLVSCGEEEVNVHIVLDRIQRLIPSLDIRRRGSRTDLRVSHEGKAERRIIAAR